MSNWVHLSITFKSYQNTLFELQNDAAQEKPTGIYRELVCYLKEAVDSVSGLVNRYFYLFEPNPHLFLALEVKAMKDIEPIKNEINQIKKPNFIESAKIDLDTSDDGNGEVAIGFFHIGTKFAFFRTSDNYKPGYYNNNEVKLVHCFSNQLFVTLDNEVNFYLSCLRHRGVQV